MTLFGQMPQGAVAALQLPLLSLAGSISLPPSTVAGQVPDRAMVALQMPLRALVVSGPDSVTLTPPPYWQMPHGALALPQSPLLALVGGTYIAPPEPPIPPPPNFGGYYPYRVSDPVILKPPQEDQYELLEILELVIMNDIL